VGECAESGIVLISLCLEFYAIKQRKSRLGFVRHSFKKGQGMRLGRRNGMAEPTDTSNVVTDPHTLLGVSRAIIERISPRTNQLGSYAPRLNEQIRLLFIDKQQGLFVFGVHDNATLTLAKLYVRSDFESALKEIFEEDVRAELVSFNEDHDSLSTLIAGFSEQRTEVSQDKTDPQEEITKLDETRDVEPPVETEREATHLNSIQLGLIQSNLRSVFTSPKRVVVVPGYLLRWIPYIGPLRASIVVACFQAFYLSKKVTAKANQTFEAPAPFLAAVAGIAESSVWRHLDDPELGWFLKKVPYKRGEKQWVRDERAGLTKKLPTRFLFRSTSPLTPGDADALRAYLLDLQIQENPVEILTNLVRGEYRVEPRDVFPFPAPPPANDWQQGAPESSLIHNLIFSAIGIEAKAATKVLTDLVDELVERLLPANDQLHLSWYFLQHWQPLLGHGPAWATILLRDRCFYNRQTGELRDTVSIRGGYQELAQALGLQRVKTIREWFPAPHAQQEAVKSANLSSPVTLEKIAQSKRGFVKEYAARFVNVIEADADGRGQVSSFKAQVKLFDPLTPVHEAIYTALFPLTQRYFTLPQEKKTAFLNAFDEVSTMSIDSIERIIQETSLETEEISQKYTSLDLSGDSCEFEEAAIPAFLGAIEMITYDNPGAIRRIAIDDLGAIEGIPPVDSGAVESLTLSDLGGFERLTKQLSGAFEKFLNADTGAFEIMGLVFWAHMRVLKYLVLNNHICESLKEYFQNTDLNNTENRTSTTNSEDKEALTNGDRLVEVYPEIENWNLNKILDNFSPHVKRDLLERGATVQAMLSCLFYIASSKGDNLGLGYVVEKLKVYPQDGQGGIYLRIAEAEPEDIIARLRSYIEYRSFQDRDWRVAMGTPSTEKILELLEHLGLDSSKFSRKLFNGIPAITL
jgi:hypothetical protein